MNTQTEKATQIMTDIKTQLETYYLEIGLVLCILAGARTEYNCYIADMSPFWGLLWGLPMMGLVLLFDKQKNA